VIQTSHAMNTHVRRPRSTSSTLGIIVGATIAALFFALFQPALTSVSESALNAIQNHGRPLSGSVLFAQENRTRADTLMSYIYNAPESPLDKRYEYHWTILKTALEKTKKKYGPYSMVPSEFMNERRQAFELKNATGKLTVMYLSTIPDFERNLIPIRIPVDKNLGGYCIFLVRKDDMERFKSVSTLDDLRKFSYGLGLGWIDVDILKSNSFSVVTGSSYEGLFEMLVNKRFDVFLRAAVEVLGEYEERKNAMPDLAIEENIILYYPLPMYFWFSKTEEGRRLAKRAEEGMREMINDGTFDKIFNEYQGFKIERLNLKKRKLFTISNPFLGPETPFGDKRLWFDPKSNR
jgi:ABC-type amino acid transport substrate-binding protein